MYIIWLHYKYLDQHRFVPSSITYMEKQAKVQDQVAMPSQINQREETTKRDSETNDIADRSQEARFGFTNIGSTGSVSNILHIIN